jgi:hypothetical protein
MATAPESPGMKEWLGGIEPAWRLLDEASSRALRYPPSPSAGPIRLATDLTPPEIQQSAVARTALLLMKMAATKGGLKLTANGNLSRAVIAEMIDLITWPDFDWADAAWLHKVVNEIDFLPAYVVRPIAQAAKLLRKHKGLLKLTSAGQRYLEGPDQRALQALLFHIALWHFDMWFFQDLHQGWPRQQVGIVLWSLSIAANDWQSPERLTRLCAIPVDSVLEDERDRGTWLMEARILRPLLWFGLLELRKEKNPASSILTWHFYRKAPLFDRFLAFEIELQDQGAPRH